MSDIIEEIYNGMLARNHDYSLEDQDMLRRDAELWDRASPALGHEMVEIGRASCRERGYVLV